MRQSTRTTRLAAGLAASIAVTTLAAVAAPAQVAAHPPKVTVHPAITGHVQAVARVAPLSTSDCVAQIGIHCYSPLQYRNAYNLNPLYAKGVTGAGRTIVIVDSFGSPTIQHDLEAFDAQWGLPDTSVQIVQAGTIPPVAPAHAPMVGWAPETTIDVGYAPPKAGGGGRVPVGPPVAGCRGGT